MIKNLILHRLSATHGLMAERLDATLGANRFAPCGPTQPASAGWIPPRGLAGGPLVESIGGHWLLKMMIEQKLLPAPVVARHVDTICAHIEQTEGRKPGRKERKDIKERATLELLPAAFTRRSATLVWIDPTARLLAIDAGSMARADDVIVALARALDTLLICTIDTHQSPQAAMAEWLTTGEPPAGLTVDCDCELRSTNEMKSVVRYNRHSLDITEISEHIQTQGKVPTRLALTWRGRVSFTLTDTLQVKKINFLDGVYEGRHDTAADEFDADAAIATGELSQLIPDLLAALGGELLRAQEGSAA